MTKHHGAQLNLFLWIGDILILVLVTLAGFGSHQELGAGVARMAATLVPLLAAWFFTAVPAGLMKPDRAREIKRIGLVLWGMILAGPLAAVLRGFWLNSPVVPVFAVVLGGTGALAMVVWRLGFILVIKRLAK